MENSESAGRDIHRSSRARGIMRWLVKQTVFVLIVAAALFASAGSFASPRVWLYLGLVAFIQVLTALLLIPHNPNLLIERSQLKEGIKAWDIGFAVFMGYSPAFLALAAGLQTRFSAPPAHTSMSAIPGM